MAAAVTYEKFWNSKSACCEAERLHYESLAKAKKSLPLMAYEKVWIDKKKYDNVERQYCEKLAKYPVVMADTKDNLAKESPAPSPQKSSKRRRRNKGHSESSNRGDSVSESISSCNEEIVPEKVTPVETQTKPEKSKAPKCPESQTKALAEPQAKASAEPQTKASAEPQAKPPVAPQNKPPVAPQTAPSVEPQIKPVAETVSKPVVEAQPKPAEETQTKPPTAKEQKQNKKNKNKNDNKGNKPEEVKDTKKDIVEIEANLDKGANNQLTAAKRSLASEVAEARLHIKKSLECMDSVLACMPNVDVTTKLNNVVSEVSQISTALNDLRSLVMSLKKDVEQLKSQKPRQVSESKPSAPTPVKPAPAPAAKDEEDDGVDLFASESEDEEAAKIKEERLAAYAAKKAKKPALIAKSSIILDVKPWDDETDMAEMEKKVRKIESDGLLWGASKLVPLAYGIKKLQINCVVEDDKISVDWLQEEIEGITDLVQSCDIAAFNKI